MDVVRLGRGIRALRIRRRWRQVDLAAAARVSQTVVARLELGRAGGMTLDRVARVAETLGARVEVRLNWQGEALDRLLDAEHASLVEAVARQLRSLGWEVRTEVTFWIRGERGSVDILAWHPGTRIALVIEIKSVVPDVQATLSAHDRKARLGVEIAESVGWRAAVVARLLVIGESRTARRRIAQHDATFRAALPHRYREIRAFLRNPRTDLPLRGLMFLSGSHRLTTRHRQPKRAPRS